MVSGKRVADLVGFLSGIWPSGLRNPVPEEGRITMPVRELPSYPQ